MLRGVNRGVGTILSVIVFIHVFRKRALKVFLILWDVKFTVLQHVDIHNITYTQRLEHCNLNLVNTVHYDQPLLELRVMA